MLSQVLQACRRSVAEHVDLTLLDDDVIDPALGDRMDDGAKLVELHRPRRRLTTEFVDDVETGLLEPFDQRLPLVIFEYDVVLGDFEAHQLFTFQERFQAVQFVLRIGVFKQHTAGKWMAVVIAVKLGCLLHGLFGQQKTVHGVNFRVIDVIGGTFEQAFYAAAPAGPAHFVGTEVDHRGEAPFTRFPFTQR